MGKMIKSMDILEYVSDAERDAWLAENVLHLGVIESGGNYYLDDTNPTAKTIALPFFSSLEGREFIKQHLLRMDYFITTMHRNDQKGVKCIIEHPEGYASSAIALNENEALWKAAARNYFLRQSEIEEHSLKAIAKRHLERIQQEYGVCRSNS